MWNILKGKSMMGYDFHRQKPLLKYIVDFFCYELMLAIEIDGFTHHEDDAYVSHRQQELETVGVYVLRFNALDVVHKTADVVREIESWIENYQNRSEDSIV